MAAISDFLTGFKSTSLSVQEKKRKIDFQDGCHDGHLGFLIQTILAISDLQVTPIRTILAIFDLQVTPNLPTQFESNGLSVQEKK